VDDEGGYSADGRLLTNIVMMGMGEPLYNFDNVRDALKLVMDGDGLAFRRRITLSTSGVVPMMARAGAEIGVNLAVSLHAVNKQVRDEIVPINRKYGLEELLQACADYPGASNARRITFEYVMLKDKNDSDEDARELVRLIRQYKLPAKVNLIPFNPWPGAPYECSSPERIRRFRKSCSRPGSAPRCAPRGRDRRRLRPVEDGCQKIAAPNWTGWWKKSRPRWAEKTAALFLRKSAAVQSRPSSVLGHPGIIGRAGRGLVPVVAIGVQHLKHGAVGRGDMRDVGIIGHRGNSLSWR
jgi:hypothetical protein